MNRRLHIVWPNQQTVTIHLEDNPVADYYYDCMKHLQHVPLEFDLRSNSLIDLDFNSLVNSIQKTGNALGLIIDPAKLTSQDYLNFLHDVYFQHASQPTFDNNWLKFHDTIHLIEDCVGLCNRHSQIWFDYLEKAGPFVKPFDRSWLKFSTTRAELGNCVIGARELGKTLLIYKNNNEPRDLKSMIQLAKPWCYLKPALSVELKNEDQYEQFKISEEEEFLNWFEPYRASWCEHWQIKDWQPREIFAKIVLGKIDDLTTLTENFSNGYYPTHIKR